MAAAAATAILTVLTVTPIAAQAATTAGPALTNKLVHGFQDQVSCLTSKLCVLAGYNSFGTGDIVALRNGVPGTVSVVRHTSRVYTVSCPNSGGCVAVADPSSGAGAEFVSVSKSGVVTSAKAVSDPAGDSITEISCTKLTNCDVAGTNLFTTPWKIVAGTWNGKKLSLHTVSSPKGTTTTSILGLSCASTNCDVVGYSTSGATDLGLSLPVSSGKPGKLHTAKGDSFYGVSCVSKSVCYATGFKTNADGLVVTIKNGAIGPGQTTAASLFGIACSGATCTAVGEQIPPQTSKDVYWGTLISLSSGKISKTITYVQVSFGFNGVARVGKFFAAVGASQGNVKYPTEVTTG
jgi:hypothetical protein